MQISVDFKSIALGLLAAAALAVATEGYEFLSLYTHNALAVRVMGAQGGAVIPIEQVTPPPAPEPTPGPTPTSMPKGSRAHA